MDLNADFKSRVVVHSDQITWQASPMPGVDRRMLDRIGDEVARATSIVCYAPDSTFSAHTHTGGEEFIVLEGVFQDEHGDYPAGTYVRNPPTSAHTPGSKDGCVIFVKLWQFDKDDRTQFRKTMDDEVGRVVAGIASATLHRDQWEVVTYNKIDAGVTLTNDDAGGIEVLVITGTVTNEGETLGQRYVAATAGGADFDDCCRAGWRKDLGQTGHLRHARPPAV